MRISALGNLRHEMILDLHQDLRADAQVAFHENIERVIDRALGGVFDRHHAVVGVAARDHVEDIGDADVRRVIHARAEFAPRGLVRVRRFRPEVGDRQILLQGERGGHDLAVNRADRLFRQPALETRVLRRQRAQHRLLALRRVDLRALGFLHQADLMHQIGALVEQSEKLLVDRVDLLANLGERHGGRSLDVGSRNSELPRVGASSVGTRFGVSVLPRFRLPRSAFRLCLRHRQRHALQLRRIRQFIRRSSIRSAGENTRSSRKAAAGRAPPRGRRSSRGRDRAGPASRHRRPRRARLRCRRA